MKQGSKLLTVVGLLGGAVLLSSCKVSKCVNPDGTETQNCVQIEPLKKYVGDTPETTAAAWSAGKSLTIINGNGTIVVDTAGLTGQISVEGIPFDTESNDPAGRQTAIDVMANSLHLVAAADASGNGVVVSGDGTGLRGFEMTVHLPPTFDGALTVTGKSGSVTVTTTTTSPSTTVSASAGDIVVHNAVGQLVITGSAGNIEVSARPQGPGNSIKTDVGDINAAIASDANLTIDAKCTGGTVTLKAGMNATLSTDKTTAAITLGDGSGALAVESGLGDIFFQ